ncbi:MAG: hypothetical protein ABI647_25495, partial [Gemmatimonadota bacterium]
MRTARLYPLVLLPALWACSPEPPAESIPDWLRAKITELEHAPVANPPLWVGRYDYTGQVVYYVPPHCCDIMSALLAADGTVICAPDGGMTGRGDGRCPDFLDQRK